MTKRPSSPPSSAADQRPLAAVERSFDPLSPAGGDLREGEGVSDPVTSLEAALVDHIRTNGPIGFDEYVAHALYTPELGFYAGGGGAGRRRDFLTSPEVGSLFGAVVARALDTWWDELGRPERFPVVEAGAGPGTLARSVLAAAPRCAAALELVLVEPSESQWVTHPDGVVSRTELPRPGSLGDGPVVVLANELLDNLPFGLVELVEGHDWCEVVVRLADDDADLDVDAGAGAENARWGGTPFAYGWVPLDERRVGWCRGRAGRDAEPGCRMPVQADAAVWLHDALELAAGGRVVVVDYASTSSDLARRPSVEWLRTYAGHGRGSDPLIGIGTQDITCEVAIDQLATVAPPDHDRSQADFLRTHGIDELVAEGRAAWNEHGPTLPGIAGRSRVHEAEALTDPSGLGAFWVLEWVNP